MEYYIASDQGPLGPYTLEELRLRPIKGEELVWRNGLAEWVRADSLEELSEALNPTTPPTFNRSRFEQNNLPPQQPTAPAYEQGYYEQEQGECPPNYRWLAILTFLGIIPCAIVAIIKSSMVTRLWEEGKYEAARQQSRSVVKWSIIGCVIGIPLNIYYMFFWDFNPAFLELFDL